MKLSNVAFMLFSVLISGHCYAYDGWSGLGVITTVRTYTGYYVMVQQATIANPSGCANHDYMYLSTPEGSDNAKRLYAAVLEAYASQRPVNFAVIGCSGGGTTGWPVIEQVWME